MYAYLLYLCNHIPQRVFFLNLLFLDIKLCSGILSPFLFYSSTVLLDIVQDQFSCIEMNQCTF